MKFDNKIAAFVFAETLHRLFAVLEDEAIPFSARVCKVRGKTHLIIIDTNDCDHFASIISKCKNGL